MKTAREKNYEEGRQAFSPNGSHVRSCPYLAEQHRIDWFDGWADSEIKHSKMIKEVTTWKDQPTEDGYYWLRRSSEKDVIVFYESAVWYDVEKVTGKWSGPVMPPI